MHHATGRVMGFYAKMKRPACQRRNEARSYKSPQCLSMEARKREETASGEP
jgi:hypothetical protein